MEPRDRINAICAAFPGAETSDPWGGGHDAWKLGGKMFACIGAVTPGVSVKTDSIETAEMLIEAGVGAKAPYFHRSWLLLAWDAPEDELRHRLETSYRLIRAGLPKGVQANLGSTGFFLSEITLGGGPAYAGTRGRQPPRAYPAQTPV